MVLRGFKQAVACTECQTIQFYEDAEEAEKIENTEKCNYCGAPLKYVGLRPFHETLTRSISTLKPAIDDIKNASVDQVFEQPPIPSFVYTQDSVEKTIKSEPKIETEVAKEFYKANGYKIDDIIEKGARGVTNAQMIPAIRNALDENSTEKIVLLKESYPAVFEASIRYIGKKYQDKLQLLNV